MNRTRSLIAAALLGAAAAAPAIAAQAADASAPRMADVMSTSELRETGIANLTPAQRSALDAWLARYTAIVEHAASRGAQAAGVSSGGGDNGEAYSGPVAVPYGSRIRLVRDGGTSIVLADGTVWEVYLPNRPSTKTWAVGDFVIVKGRAVEQNGEYYYTLTNGRDGSSAAVNWKGKE
jgi:hypothetical protein